MKKRIEETGNSDFFLFLVEKRAPYEDLLFNDWYLLYVTAGYFRHPGPLPFRLLCLRIAKEHSLVTTSGCMRSLIGACPILCNPSLDFRWRQAVVVFLG